MYHFCMISDDSPHSRTNFSWPKFILDQPSLGSNGPQPLNYLRLFKQTWDMWPSAVAKRLWHLSHFSNVTSPLVCIIACFLRASHLLKSSEHFSQRYLVVPVCRFSCLRWSLDCLKAFGQNEHLKGRSPTGWNKEDELLLRDGMDNLHYRLISDLRKSRQKRKFPVRTFQKQLISKTWRGEML